MIRLALPNSPYIVPETGKPVEGRMKVFVHDSGELAELFTLEGPDYVQAENPQLLHAGLTDTTLFTALGVFDVVVERYVGTEGAMSVDSPDEDFEQVGVYEVGMDFDIESYSRNSVDTISDLRDVDPSLGMVTVKWYSEEGDCAPRTYLWDAESENTEDGGYVVGSDVSDSGKWILMWDDDTIPCSVYGVKPGTEANIALLLSYPAVVGSFQMATAPKVRFLRGTYSSSNTWSTTKELVFDPDAKFTSAAFTCPKIQAVAKRTTYIADFTFTANDAVAHSSWFASVTAFWFCGAKKLIIDDVNWFSDSTLSGSPELVEAVIEGSKRMAVTYASGRYLTFTKCTFNASRILSPADDKVKFNNSEWHDGLWTTTDTAQYDFGKISDGHRVEFLSSASNNMSLSRFSVADTWLKMMDANIRDVPTYTDTVAELEGRKISNFAMTRFSKLRDAVVTGDATMQAWMKFEYVQVLGDLTLAANVTLDHVDVTGTVYGGDGTLVIRDSKVKWSDEPADGSTIAASGSSVESVGTWTGDHAMEIVNCDFAISLDNAVDNTTQTRYVTIVDSRLTKANNQLLTKMLFIRGCYLSGQDIRVFPYKEGNNYRIFLEFFDNVVESARNVWLTRLDTVGGSEDVNCKDISLRVKIVGNDFIGAGNVRIDYWADPSRRTLFLSTYPGNHVYEYSGNRGSAPLEKWTGHKSSTTNTLEWIRNYSGGTDSQYYVFRVGRVSPGFSKGSFFTNGMYTVWAAQYEWLETFSYTIFGTAAATDDTQKGDWYDCMFVSSTDETGEVRIV